MATCIELLANARRATGTGKAEVANYLLRAQQIRAGKPPKVNIVKAFRAALAALRRSPFTGDPPADWLTAKRALRESSEAALQRAARQLDFTVAFQRGHRISAALSAEWLRDGAYTRGRAALDSALAQEQILDGAEPPRGIQVMNWHKAKDKQFDAVILLREGRFGDGGLKSSFIWRGDQPPYPKSRRLVSVAAPELATA